MSDGSPAAIHPVAEAGFARTASEYERGRPDYPAAAIDWLVQQCALGIGRTLVDLGAGTGKLTRLLVRSGATLVAIEPIEEMRRELRLAVPGVQTLAGTAEEIPLPGASADVVAAGQAFHWFDVARAAPEIHRVLRPGGSLALIWNVRDPADRLQQELRLILRRHGGDAPRAYTWSGEEGAWRAPLEGSGLFALGGEERFPYAQELTAEALLDRVASVSFIGALAPDEREGVLEEVRALARRQSGPIVLAYRTSVYRYVRA